MAGLSFLLVLLSSTTQAAEPSLTVTVGGETRNFTREQLLARDDATTIEVAKDITYRVPMTYRAIPVAALLAGMNIPPDSVIEAVALDGFTAQLPLDLVLNSDESKAVAWLAIEQPDHPWPPVEGKQASAGPFYTVWTGADAASIRASSGRSRWRRSRANPLRLRAGPLSPSIRRSRRQTQSVPAKPCSWSSASPATD
jgi:hypothetical protein